MNISKVDSVLLNVTSNQEFQHLHGQAMDIVGWAKEEQGNVSIMMHTPSAEQISDVEAVSKKMSKPVALIGGQLGLMINLREELIRAGFVVVEAKTDRVSEEVTQPDGSVKKVSVFKHRGLRILS
jgi:hypothetical protein